jgi:hypothetical protein
MAAFSKKNNSPYEPRTTGSFLPEFSDKKQEKVLNNRDNKQYYSITY